MSVGVLIITHEEIGQVMLNTAKNIIGSSPLPIQAMSIHMDANTEQLIQQASTMLQELDQGNGVLVITDMYGSTPSNIANTFCGTDVQVVAGLNLPMLIRIMNYPQLSLKELVDKAVSGGQDSIMTCSYKEV